MKFKYVTLILFSVVICTQSFGADRFPRQPAISSAYAQLNSAQRQIERASQGDQREKNLSEAAINLTSAATSLEGAAKNKGPHRSAAIKLIEQAKLKVEAAKTDPSHTEKASALTKEAIERVVKAGEIGSR